MLLRRVAAGLLWLLAILAGVLLGTVVLSALWPEGRDTFVVLSPFEDPNNVSGLTATLANNGWIVPLLPTLFFVAYAVWAIRRNSRHLREDAASKTPRRPD